MKLLHIIKDNWFFRIFGGIFFIFVLLYPFVREYKRISSVEVSSWKRDVLADCAVVLTGGSNRVREGFDLLSRGQVRKLIISGVNSGSQLREIMPLWPFYGNLNERDVVLERRSMTTFGNAQQTLPLVEALQCRDLALVTSSLHMLRAYKTFLATYPSQIKIHSHVVNSSRLEADVLEISTEVLKSIFYSLWAY